MRDLAMASIPAVQASDDLQKKDEPTASDVLLSMYDGEPIQSPLNGTHATAGDSSITSPAEEVPAAAPARDTSQNLDDSDADHEAQRPIRVLERRRHTQSAVPTGIRGLQALALQLLLKREENEFVVRQKEVELQHRRLDHEERRMALEERKVALDEERLKMEAQHHNATIQILNGMSNKLEELEKKIARFQK